MSTDSIAILGFVALFVMMLLRVPVGMAMGLVGVAGFGASPVGLRPYGSSNGTARSSGSIPWGRSSSASARRLIWPWTLRSQGLAS